MMSEAEKAAAAVAEIFLHFNILWVIKNTTMPDRHLFVWCNYSFHRHNDRRERSTRQNYWTDNIRNCTYVYERTSLTNQLIHVQQQSAHTHTHTRYVEFHFLLNKRSRRPRHISTHNSTIKQKKKHTTYKNDSWTWLCVYVLCVRVRMQAYMDTFVCDCVHSVKCKPFKQSFDKQRPVFFNSK